MPYVSWVLTFQQLSDSNGISGKILEGLTDSPESFYINIEHCFLEKNNLIREKIESTITVHQK